jgi:hypothetical protein
MEQLSAPQSYYGAIVDLHLKRCNIEITLICVNLASEMSAQAKYACMQGSYKFDVQCHRSAQLLHCLLVQLVRCDVAIISPTLSVRGTENSEIRCPRRTHELQCNTQLHKTGSGGDEEVEGVKVHLGSGSKDTYWFELVFKTIQWFKVAQILDDWKLNFCSRVHSMAYMLYNIELE